VLLRVHVKERAWSHRMHVCSFTLVVYMMPQIQRSVLSVNKNSYSKEGTKKIYFKKSNLLL